MSNYPTLTYPNKINGSKAFNLNGAGSINSTGAPFTFTRPFCFIFLWL